MLNAHTRLPVPETSQTEHWLHDAGSAQFNSLLRQRHTKPLRAFVREPACALDCSMPIGIRFDYGHHASRRTHALLYLIEIRSQIVEIDLSPGRAAAETVLFILELRHASLVYCTICAP